MKPCFFIFLALICFSCATKVHKHNNSAEKNIVLDTQEDQVDSKDKINTGAKFTDKTFEYGLEGIKAYNINVVDLNGDNFSDLVVIPSFYAQPEFYLFNSQNKRFEKTVSLFADSLKASFLLFYDLDKDGVVDVIAGVLNQETEMSREPLKFYQGVKREGRVQFIRKEVFDNAYPTTSVGLVDYDLDGDLDLFMGNWFKKYKDNLIPVSDRFYKKLGSKYQDKSGILLGELKQNSDKTMRVNATPTYSVQVCDMDQNGYPDILTTSTNRYQNKMWMNKYNYQTQKRYYQDYALSAGYAGDPEGLLNKQGSGRSFAIACTDYNNDGIMDVFLGELSHNYDGQDVDRSSLLTGRSLKFPPQFYRTEYFLDSYDPNWHQADRRAVWVDLNNDGLQDLIVDNSGYPPHSKLIVFEQQADHSFTNKSYEYGVEIINPISTVVADFNQDGKMDILTGRSQIRDENLSPRVYLFENNMDISERRSLRIFLRGKDANYHGLNATVILKVRTKKGIETRRQVVSYSYGALPAQNEEGLHFGLNASETVVSIVVKWPFLNKTENEKSLREKIYKFSLDFKEHIKLTLCESGHYLIGKRKCL
ncbi:MAG: CRTAC1 family protein [Bacteriovoracaceae bacterium]|jgi:hypothetical protein|nr:hypothetical protein [Halobacteriovoraceae bacterium]MDP7320467.1 CRTAC1 family protein [Bacteriovoracaceae bacterium]